MTFYTWHESRVIDDAIDSMMASPPAPGIDNDFDHHYLLQMPAIDHWQKVKAAIVQALEKRRDDPKFQFYPSQLAVQYDGIIGRQMHFLIYGLQKREINDAPNWLPPKGVTGVHKVVQTLLP